MTAPALFTGATMSASSCGTKSELREAPGRRQSGDIEGFFECHRDAEQSPPVAERQGDIGRRSCLARALEVTDDDGIDELVQRFNPRDGVLQELRCGNLSRLEGFGKLIDAAVVPLRCRYKIGLWRRS